MPKINFTLRDEKINIKAMTLDSLPGNYPYQIILCKKSPIPSGRIGPFLLDAKKSDPTYPLSEVGQAYQEKMTDNECELKYIAYVDSYLKVRITKGLFNSLYENDFFSIWDPQAPLRYFDNNEEGFLVIFRVYEINSIVPEYLLKKGRNGRNYYYRLSEPYDCEVSKAVLSDEDFNEMKQNLINLLITEDYLIKIDETNYDKPAIQNQEELPLLSQGDTITNDELREIFKCSP